MTCCYTDLIMSFWRSHIYIKLIDGLGGFDLLLIVIFLVASSEVNGNTIDSACGRTLGPNLKRTNIRAVVNDATKYSPPPQAARFRLKISN